MDKPMSVYAKDAPRILRDFLTYISTIQGKSPKTAYEYYLDLRLFFRVVLRNKDRVPLDLPIKQISIKEIDIDFIREITLSDIYDYLEYLSSERPTQQNSVATGYGLSSISRARKIAAVRSLFKYLCDKKNLIEYNPINSLEAPKRNNTLPAYLSLEESRQLLESVTGQYAVRDFCILVFFLNCGLRVSELVGLNLSDVQSDYVCVTGKGSKQRMIYLSDACLAALEDYLPERIEPHEHDRDALFVSRNRNRINVQTVKWLVKKHLGHAGLDVKKLSVHKLRHTAATLMYQNGVDIRTLQTVLGHSNVSTTMLYTHIRSKELREAALKNPLCTVQRQSSVHEDTAKQSSQHRAKRPSTNYVRKPIKHPMRVHWSVHTSQEKHDNQQKNTC